MTQNPNTRFPSSSCNGPQSRRRYGSLNSEAFVESYGSRFRGQNKLRYRNSPNYKNQNHSPYQRRTQFQESSFRHEYFSLKQQIDEKNDIVVQFEYINKQSLPHINIEKWIDKLRNVCTTNKWTVAQLKPTLEILCQPEFTNNLSPAPTMTPELLLKKLQKNFYPETRFMEIERKLERIKAINFASISNFYEEFIQWFKRANLCLPFDEKLSERDKKRYFIAALTNTQKHLFIDNDFDDTEAFVKLVENRKLKQEKYNVDEYEIPRRKYKLHEQLSSLDIDDRPMRKQKYCYLHKTRNHDTSECRDTNNQRKFQNSETKKEEHSAFFY